jgi:hypothetical protein
MKKIIIFTFILFSITSCFSQQQLIFNKEKFIEGIALSDSSLSVKLKNFFDNGYEKNLSLEGVTAEDLISSAQSYLGTPHCMGGTTKSCIDCSGLLYAVFNDFGITIPHGSEEMARYGKIITDTTNLIRGDLVFFVKSYNTSKVITHSGFYMGNGIFIHASASKGVEEINFFKSTYWSEKFIFGTRIF